MRLKDVKVILYNYFVTDLRVLKELYSEDGRCIMEDTKVFIDEDTFYVYKVFNIYYISCLVASSNCIYSIQIQSNSVENLIDEFKSFFIESNIREVFFDLSDNNKSDWKLYLDNKISFLKCYTVYSINLIFIFILLIIMILLFLFNVNGIFFSSEITIFHYCITIFGIAWLSVLGTIKYNIKVYDYNMKLYFKNLFNRLLIIY